MSPAAWAATRALTRLNAVVATYADRKARAPTPAQECAAEVRRVRAVLSVEERNPEGRALADWIGLALDVAETAMAWGSDQQVREAARLLRRIG